MRTPTVVLVALAGVLWAGQASAQKKPDFSGTWILVEAPDHGANRDKTPSRDGRGGGDSRRVIRVSGAPVNCELECTIVQNAEVLTLSRPANTQSVRPPQVVLRLDGRPSEIVQSSTSSATYTVTATWDGDKIVVNRLIAHGLSVTQTISMEKGKMVVYSDFSTENDTPLTLSYTRK